MRDFTCCGLTLDNMHELLEHYEDRHHHHMEEPRGRSALDGPVVPDPKAALANSTATALKDAHPRQQIPSKAPDSRTHPRAAGLLAVDGVDDEAICTMEMDDDVPHPRLMSGAQYGRQLQLDDDIANPSTKSFHSHCLRQSTPSTPNSSGGLSFGQLDPTVSSVNTPSLSHYAAGHQSQLQNFYTPDSSLPGTPGELDPDFLGILGQMNFGSNGLKELPAQNARTPGTSQLSHWNFSSTDEGLGLCIDEPAKRLYAPGHAGTMIGTKRSHDGTCVGQKHDSEASNVNNESACQLGDGQYSEDSELARTIREQQKLAGVPDPSADGISKPFHCPVIGCEKAYKNHNGLKYHKTVSARSLSDPELMIAWSQYTKVTRQQQWYIQHSGPRHSTAISRHVGHGKTQAIPMSQLWQALQESQWTKISQNPFFRLRHRRACNLFPAYDAINPVSHRASVQCA